jgi:hypothetical protein
LAENDREFSDNLDEYKKKLLAATSRDDVQNHEVLDVVLLERLEKNAATII